MITLACIIGGMLLMAGGGVGFMAEAMADTQGTQTGAWVSIVLALTGAALVAYGLWRLFS